MERRPGSRPTGRCRAGAGLIALVYGIVNVQKVGWTSGTTIVWVLAAGIVVMATLAEALGLAQVDVDHPMTEMAA
jgi:hypothetical protein